MSGQKIIEGMQEALAVARGDAQAHRTTVYTDVPPVLRRNLSGQLEIVVVAGPVTTVAPLGDGSYFFDRVTELMLVPALQQLGPVHVPVREPPERQDGFED